MSDNVKKNLALWDRNYNWTADGNEWVGQAAVCGVPYETWKASLVSKLIAPFARKDAHTLEIAPGHGRWSEYIIEASSYATLVDLSPACLDFCRDRFADKRNVDYFLTTGLQLPKCAEGQIGFVFSYDSFVHMSADVIESYMAEIERVLVPGGAALVHHADVAELSTHKQEHIWQRSAVNRSTVRELAEKAGLTVRRQFDFWDEENKIGCPGDAITLLRKDRAP
jgi:ubiquinone/menaquinone biosynthesis C-methylase UbiE